MFGLKNFATLTYSGYSDGPAHTRESRLAGHKSSEPDIVIREGRELMYTVGARPRDFECSRHQKSATVCP
jgi:hypothetical protein